jgi:hypothetical protein
MDNNEQTQNLDNVIAFIVIKKLVTPVEATDAFQKGLIDKTGRIIKMPETDEENSALTTLDKFIFKLKRLLGAKISQLNNFMYLHTVNSGLHRNLFVRGNVENRAEIKRVKKGLDRLGEELDMSVDKIIKLYANNLLEETDNEI